MDNSASLRSWLYLRAVPGIGDTLYCRLIDAFGTPDAVLAGCRSRLIAVAHVSTMVAEAIMEGPGPEARRAAEEELG